NHPLVNKVAFTGSTDVGKHIMSQASGNLKRVTLELGGKSPNIILPDADLSRAIPGAMSGIMMNQGEVCSAGSRLFVQKNRSEERRVGKECGYRRRREHGKDRENRDR